MVSLGSSREAPSVPEGLSMVSLGLGKAPWCFLSLQRLRDFPCSRRTSMGVSQSKRGSVVSLGSGRLPWIERGSMVSIEPWGAPEFPLAHRDLHGCLSVQGGLHGCLCQSKILHGHLSQSERFSMVASQSKSVSMVATLNPRGFPCFPFSIQEVLHGCYSQSRGFPCFPPSIQEDLHGHLSQSRGSP